MHYILGVSTTNNTDGADNMESIIERNGTHYKVITETYPNPFHLVDATLPKFVTETRTVEVYESIGAGWLAIGRITRTTKHWG